jgi:hypothetical protein
MISEKTLRKWRGDALKMEVTNVDSIENPNPDTIISAAHYIELKERILRLTQELMDHHLMRKDR